MSNTKIVQLGMSSHKGVEIKLDCRRGKIGRFDYGYKLPSGVWGAGFGTKEKALSAAKQAIREGKR